MEFFYLYKPTDDDNSAAYSVTNKKKGIIHHNIDYDDTHSGLAYIVRHSLNNNIKSFGHIADNLPIIDCDYLSIIRKSVDSWNGDYYVVNI
jgi:hypothetical protein